MRRDRNTTPQHDPHPRCTPWHAPRHRSQAHSRTKNGKYLYPQTRTKPSVSIAAGTEQNLCEKNQQRNGKNKRMRPRQRPKSNAATGPVTRGPTSAVVGAAEAVVVAVSTPASLQIPKRKLRNTCGGGGRVRGVVDTSSFQTFCAQCTMRQPPQLARSRARSFPRGQRIRAPSESSEAPAQNKHLRAPAVHGELERQT